MPKAKRPAVIGASGLIARQGGPDDPDMRAARRDRGDPAAGHCLALAGLDRKLAPHVLLDVEVAYELKPAQRRIGAGLPKSSRQKDSVSGTRKRDTN